MTKTATKPVKKTIKKATKKTVPAEKQVLPVRQQWLIVALLVVVLFLFACFVYGVDMFWYANS